MVFTAYVEIVGAMRRDALGVVPVSAMLLLAVVATRRATPRRPAHPTAARISAQAELEFDETMNQWKQRSQLTTLLKPHALPYSDFNLEGLEPVERDDFVDHFVIGDLESGRFTQGLQHTWAKSA